MTKLPIETSLSRYSLFLLTSFIVSFSGSSTRGLSLSRGHPFYSQADGVLDIVVTLVSHQRNGDCKEVCSTISLSHSECRGVAAPIWAGLFSGVPAFPEMLTGCNQVRWHMTRHIEHHIFILFLTYFMFVKNICFAGYSSQVFRAQYWNLYDYHTAPWAGASHLVRTEGGTRDQPKIKGASKISSINVVSISKGIRNG